MPRLLPSWLWPWSRRGVARFISLLVVRYHHTPFARSCNLEEVKREGARFSEQPDRLALIGGAKSLPRIIHQDQVMLADHFHDRVHVTHAAAHMHETHTFRLWCDGLADSFSTQA